MSARLDGEIDDLGDAELAGHLRSCADCAARESALDDLHRRTRVRLAERIPDLSAAIVAAAPRRRPRRRAALLAAAAFVAVALAGTALATALTTGRAAPALAADVAVTPEPLGSAGVVYLVLSNAGGSDALVAASSDVADRVGIHRVTTDDGRLLMQPTPRLDCTGGLVQDAASSHLMLTGLRRSLRPGDRFDLRLVFERSGAIDVTVTVVEWSALPDHLPER